VNRRSPRAAVQRLGQVLHGLAFPAAKWQLIMHAEDYGADSGSRAELWSLPTGVYTDRHAVFEALGWVAPRPAAGRRPAPAAESAAREHPPG
jgi:hypothetical protein